MTASRADRSSLRIGCRGYAFQDAAAAALLALVIGGFVLQLVRRPAEPGRADREGLTAADMTQQAVAA